MTSDTGRYWVKIDGRRFLVEPIDNRHEQRVQLQPSETVVEDSKKHKGSIKSSESLISAERGFTNIYMLPAGTSPEGFIERLVRGKPVLG